VSDLKFIFTGTPGVGKTTAISMISEFDPVVTDVFSTDELAEQKERTTVAMDFGEITLDDNEKIRLYGTPGQRRFQFMWEILIEGGLGLVILIDNSRTNPLEDLDMYLENFKDFIQATGAVIGVTRMQTHPVPDLDQYYAVLESLELDLPVLDIDVREKDDVIMLLDALMAISEYD
jgi:uncharacterized protein